MVVFLAGGPRELLGRTWDYHVLLFGALTLSLGYNLVLFDAFAKAFSSGAGLARMSRVYRGILRFYSLERGLVLGVLLFLAGLLLEGKIVYDWNQAGRGPAMAVRGIAIGMLGMVIGAQTAFGSFLMNLLLLPRAENLDTADSSSS